VEDDDADKPDDSDNELELRICTDSSDNDVEELRNSLPSDDEEK
jgi:hypothetical protein